MKRERERDSDGGEETRGKLELLSTEKKKSAGLKGEMRHQPPLTTYRRNRYHSHGLLHLKKPSFYYYFHKIITH